MKTRTKEKRTKAMWERIARKLPDVLRTKKDRKEWVSLSSRAGRKHRRAAKRRKRGQS